MCRYQGPDSSDKMVVVPQAALKPMLMYTDDAEEGLAEEVFYYRHNPGSKIPRLAGVRPGARTLYHPLS